MNSRQYVKNLCNLEDIKYEDVAKILSERFNKKYTYQGLYGKLTRNSFTYAEASELADALGYDLSLVKKKP